MDIDSDHEENMSVEDEPVEAENSQDELGGGSTGHNQEEENTMEQSENSPGRHSPSSDRSRSGSPASHYSGSPARSEERNTVDGDSPPGSPEGSPPQSPVGLASPPLQSQDDDEDRGGMMSQSCPPDEIGPDSPDDTGQMETSQYDADGDNEKGREDGSGVEGEQDGEDDGVPPTMYVNQSQDELEGGEQESQIGSVDPSSPAANDLNDDPHSPASQPQSREGSPVGSAHSISRSGSPHDSAPASPAGSHKSGSRSRSQSRSKSRSHSRSRSRSGSPKSRSRSGTPQRSRSGSPQSPVISPVGSPARSARSRSGSPTRSARSQSRSRSRSRSRSASGSRGSRSCSRSRSGSPHSPPVSPVGSGGRHSRSGSRSKSRSRSRSGSGRSRSRSGSRSKSGSRSRSRSRSASPGQKSRSRSGSRASSPESGGHASDEDSKPKRKRKMIEDSEDEGAAGAGSGDEGDKEKDELIADIFGSSDEEEEFKGFDASEISKKEKKKKTAVKSDDEEEEGATGELEDRPPVADSDDENLDELRKEGEGGSFVSDFDLMIARKKEEQARQKRKRKDVDLIDDNDDLIADLIVKMKEAANFDRELNQKKQVAVQKIRMLPYVLNQLKKSDLHGSFLESGILSAMTEWLAPLPDKSLPHLNIRTSFLQILAQFPSIHSDLIKSSGVGKAIMYLYKHPRELKENKRMSGRLINEWSRPIFNLTSNYKMLSKEEREQRDYDQVPKKRRTSLEGAQTPKRDIDKALAGENKALRPGDPGWVYRARVPMPSHKDYVVRPKTNSDYQPPQAKAAKKPIDRYEKHKRSFLEKKKLSKTHKAVAISIEGRNMSL